MLKKLITIISVLVGLAARKVLLGAAMTIEKYGNPDLVLKPAEDGNNYVRVAFADDKAYWLNGSAVMVADVVDGEVDVDSAVQYDAIGAPSGELTKLMFILDNLKED